MKVWIDICHIPQYNFFKQLIVQLLNHNHQVVLTVLDRGRTIRIIEHEMGSLANLTIYPVGKHKMTKWSAIWDANIVRIAKLLFWIPKQHIDVAVSTTIYAPLFGKLFGIRNYSFGDDPDRWLLLVYNCRWSHKAHECIYRWTLSKPMPKGLHILPCLKEWSYLAPSVFQPSTAPLSTYGVKEKEYIFVREVTVGTINYADQSQGAVRDVASYISQLQTPSGQPMKVLFSLEEKHNRHLYPADWILLKEPIDDIHSLIYHAAALVSSGDSMAREAALLGIPSYYLGVRYNMPANLAASEVANLHNAKTLPFPDWIASIHQQSPAVLRSQQLATRQFLSRSFIDLNQYMLQLVEAGEANY